METQTSLREGVGSGGVSVAMAEAWPNLSITLADLPSTVAVAERYISEAGHKSRIQLRPTEIGAEKLEGTYDVAIIRGVIPVLSPDQNQAAEDRGRFDLIMLQAFRESDIQYHQKRSQALDEDHWSATYRTIEFIVNTAGGRESWERQKNFVSNSFQDLVNEMHRNA